MFALHQLARLSMPFLAISSLLSACAGGDKPANELPIHELQEVMRISSDEANVNLAFTGIRRIALLPDSSIVLMHSAPPYVRVYDAGGGFVSAFGRRGQGPGEFLGAGSLGTVGDTIWALNAADGIGLFAPTGQLLGGVIAGNYSREGIHVITHTVVGLLTGGELVVEHEYRTRLQGLGSTIDSAVYELVDRETDAVDAQIASFTPPVQFELPARAEQIPLLIPQDLAPRLLVRVAPNGELGVVVSDAEIWGGDPGQLRVQYFDATGRGPAREVQLPERPVPTSFADSVAQGFSTFSAMVSLADGSTGLVETDTDPAVLEKIRTELYVTEYYPVLHRIQLGADSAIWIQHAYDRELRTVVVGYRPVMRVRVPEGIEILNVSRAGAWGVRTGADGVPTVVKFRVGR